MRSVNLGVVSSLLVAATATSQNAVQWRPSTGGNGHWYVGVGVAASGSWEDASAAATALGAHLATFTTEAEFSWVVSGPASPPAIWNGVRGPYLGGVQGVAGTLKGWGWVTGEPWLPLWGPGNCGADDYCDANALTLGRCNSLTAIGYNDWPRTNSACVAYEIVGAVFEWSADCNADGVVDYGQIRAGLLADLDGDWIPDCCESGQPCPPDAREWSVSDGGNGHWYRAVAIPSGTSWTEARALAESMGGYLATCATAAEFEWLAAGVGAEELLWNGIRGPYIGGIQDLAGASTAVSGWRWITDEPWYAQWGANDCGADNYCDADALTLGRCSSSRDPVSYNDWPSGKSFCVNHVVTGMIVEWSADCNGDGEVDYRQIREGVLADADRDMIPDCCEANSGCCAGDLDLSGATDGTDLALVLSLWGTNAADAPAADIDRNGVVDAADMALVLSSWGPCR